MTRLEQTTEATGTPQKAPAVGSQVDLVLGPLPEKSGELWELKTPKGKAPFRYWTEEDARSYAAQEVAAERERLLGELRQMHAAQNGRHNYYLYAAEMLAANL